MTRNLKLFLFTALRPVTCSEIRKIPCHYSSISLLNFSNDLSHIGTSADVDEKLFPFHLPYVCIFSPSKMLFTWRRINETWQSHFWHLVNPCVQIKFTIIDMHIGFLFMNCCTKRVDSPISLWWISRAKRKEKVLSNGFGLGEMRETPSLCNKFSTLFSN